MGLVNFKINLLEHRFLSCFPAYSLQTAACPSSLSNQAPVQRLPSRTPETGRINAYDKTWED
jgi:hypothetical protein